MKKNIIILIIIFITLFFVLINTVQAENLKLQVPLLGYTESSGITEYIKNAYIAAIYILVPTAIIVIIYGGFLWVIAAGEPGKIQTAKEYITGAFLGLAIGLLMYVILSLVGIRTIHLPEPDKLDKENTNIVTTPSPTP